MIETYSVDSELCPVEMDQQLVNKLWPSLEENIMHDVIKNMFNGPADILIGIDNYWKLDLTHILSHDSHQFGVIRIKFGWTLSGIYHKKTAFRARHRVIIE